MALDVHQLYCTSAVQCGAAKPQSSSGSQVPQRVHVLEAADLAEISTL